MSVEKNLGDFLDLNLPGETHIVGDGPALKSLKSKYPEVVFHGAHSMENLPAFYNRSNVFVFPSRTDTFGLVLLEAMGCGLLVAAFPVTGPIDVVGESEAGVLDHDLEKACLDALKIDRITVRMHAETFSWEAATALFFGHLIKSHTPSVGYQISENPH